MRQTLVSLALVVLAGCVVTPGAVMYPQVETAYVYDPTFGLYFFTEGDHRYYMRKYWDYRTHEIPRGYYRYHR